VTANGACLNTTALDGQVVTFTGSFVNNGFTGTYSVRGGCDDGDQGSVTGINIYIADADAWGGTFTSSAQTTFFAPLRRSRTLDYVDQSGSADHRPAIHLVQANCS
jgi:hypothetical protein